MIRQVRVINQLLSVYWLLVPFPNVVIKRSNGPFTPNIVQSGDFMSALTQIIGDAASSHTFDLKDKDGKTAKRYTLRLIDDVLMADWEKEQLNKAREFEKGNRDAGMVTKEEYRERLDSLAEKYHSGAYSLTTWFVKNAKVFKALTDSGATMQEPKALPDDVAKALASDVADGFVLLSSLIFQCNRSEMRQLMKSNGPEVASLVGLIMRESWPVQDAKPGTEAAGPNA